MHINKKNIFRLQNVIHLKISDDDDDILFIYYIHTLLIKLFEKDHN